MKSKLASLLMFKSNSYRFGLCAKERFGLSCTEMQISQKFICSLRNIDSDLRSSSMWIVSDPRCV